MPWLVTWRQRSGSTLTRYLNKYSVWSSDIHLRATPAISFIKISLTITYLKLDSNLPGAKELNRNRDRGPNCTQWYTLGVWQMACLLYIKCWFPNYIFIYILYCIPSGHMFNFFWINICYRYKIELNTNRNAFWLKSHEASLVTTSKMRRCSMSQLTLMNCFCSFFTVAFSENKT